MKHQIQKLISQARSYAASEGLRAEPSAALLADEVERLAGILQFKAVTAEEPPHGIPVIGYNKDWEHEDYNEAGVRDCFRVDDGWISARWNNSQDCYDADDESAPTHWISPLRLVSAGLHSK